jgi:hypothetical protein
VYFAWPPWSVSCEFSPFCTPGASGQLRAHPDWVPGHRRGPCRGATVQRRPHTTAACRPCGAIGFLLAMRLHLISGPALAGRCISLGGSLWNSGITRFLAVLEHAALLCISYGRYSLDEPAPSLCFPRNHETPKAVFVQAFMF